MEANGGQEKMEAMRKLCEGLLAVEEDRMRGSKGYSIGEVAVMMRGAISKKQGTILLPTRSQEKHVALIAKRNQL